MDSDNTSLEFPRMADAMRIQFLHMLCSSSAGGSPKEEAGFRVIFAVKSRPVPSGSLRRCPGCRKVMCKSNAKPSWKNPWRLLARLQWPDMAGKRVGKQKESAMIIKHQ